jgi:glycosyltransferase involved in cell wall biosynthesis
MKVLLTATSLLAAYGGPAFLVSRLATVLMDAGVDVGLWAADQSARITPMLPAHSRVHRLIGTEAAALESFGSIDVLHDNGIWLPHNHRFANLTADYGIPRIVSTHGMLEPWAIKHKRWKKNLAWRFYQRGDLMRACCHHATSDREAENIRALRLGVPVCMIPSGIDIPEISNQANPNANGVRKIALFLGRIHPKKGLPLLIEAWQRVRPEGWLLEIAGPDEAGSREELEKRVSAAGLNQVISFLGPVDGLKKQSAFLNANLFVLPTYSENFGIVIGEALAHGLPVLTTTGAPWPMLPERGCGWWIDATVDGVTEGLRRATACDRETLRSMGAQGRRFVSAEFGWERVAKRFISTYEKLAVKRVNQ